MLADQGVPLCLEKAATPLRSALLKRSISESLWWRVNPKTGEGRDIADLGRYKLGIPSFLQPSPSRNANRGMNS